MNCYRSKASRSASLLGASAPNGSTIHLLLLLLLLHVLLLLLLVHHLSLSLSSTRTGAHALASLHLRGEKEKSARL